MTPDATHHRPDPTYLRSLVERIGLSQRECARRIGLSERTMRRNLTLQAGDYQPADYRTQFALEALADGPELCQMREALRRAREVIPKLTAEIGAIEPDYAVVDAAEELLKEWSLK